MLNRAEKQYQKYVPTQQQTNNIFQQLQNIISRLKSKKDKVSVQTKHIILSALACVDNNGQLTNENMIKYIHPNIGKKLLKDITSYKHKFNTNNKEVLLYNSKTCGNRTKVVYKANVNDAITKFWIDNTTPDPNMYKYRRLKDKNKVL